MKIALAGLLLAAACAGGTAGEGGGEGDVDGGGAPAEAPGLPLEGTPELPPRAPAALEVWLAAGHHRAWLCENQIFAPRGSGNHGRHRICSNAALLASVAGPYPVGAASVKELFTREGAGNGFAVGVKVAAGAGPSTWFWYERRGEGASAPPLATGVGVPDCAVCHGTAARDNVFFRAPE